ncbi:MAG: CocE/NonD family hydrolase, partial [Promethearchaeota archaeon]
MNETYNVKKRVPRKISFKELKLPEINFASHFNFMKPFVGTLGPMFSSSISLLLGKGLLLGAPFRVRDVSIPMKDGVITAADVYFPRKVLKNRMKASTILVRTPYWKDQNPAIGYHFAQHGFVVVIHDIRGAGHSKNGYNSFTILEREDALMVVDWLKSRFWYNGKIGTWGASYLGMTQNVIADNEDVTCFNVQVSSPQNLWTLHQGLGINELLVALSRIHCDCTWFPDPVLPTKQERMPYWQYTNEYIVNPAKALYNAKIGEERMAFRDFDGKDPQELIDAIKAIYDVDLRDTKRDAKKYQRFVMDMLFKNRIDKFHEFMPGTINFDYSKIKRPNLIISGWYDMFSLISLKDFEAIRSHASELARKYTKIVVGPWAHGEVRHPDIKNPLHGGM